MKYYATESSLNAAKREKLEQQMAEFLEKGGTITEVDNKGNAVKKSAVKSLKPDTSDINLRSIERVRAQATMEKEKRLAVQYDIIKEYDDFVKMEHKWAYLIKRAGVSIGVAQLTKILYRISTIANKDKFDKLKAAATKIIAEHKEFAEKHADDIERLSRAGVNCPEKVRRILKQQPVLMAYHDEFKDEVNCFKSLSEAMKGVVSEKHLRRIAKGQTSIPCEAKFKIVENTINKLMSMKNEKKAS